MGHFNSNLCNCEFHVNAKKFPTQILLKFKLVMQIHVDQQKGVWFESDGLTWASYFATLMTEIGHDLTFANVTSP